MKEPTQALCSYVNIHSLFLINRTGSFSQLLVCKKEEEVTAASNQNILQTAFVAEALDTIKESEVKMTRSDTFVCMEEKQDISEYIDQPQH